MDWAAIRLVLEIQRTGSLAGAARKLGVNHATVSRQLARAEDLLGQRLFDRLPDGVQATGVGRLVAEHGERMEGETLALARSLGAADGKLTGPLTITVPPLLAAKEVAADLAVLRRDMPDLDLRLVSDNRVLNLHKREADIAIRITRTPPDSLWGRKLVDQTTTYFASPAFQKDHRLALRGEGDLPVIGFTAWAEPLPEGVLTRFPNASVAAVCDDMAAAIGLAREGLGLLRAPCFVGRGADGLRHIPDTPFHPYAPIWVLTHPSLRRIPQVKAVMRHFATRFAARRAVYVGVTAQGDQTGA